MRLTGKYQSSLHTQVIPMISGAMKSTQIMLNVIMSFKKSFFAGLTREGLSEFCPV